MSKTLACLLLASFAACAPAADVHYSGDSSRPELAAIDEAPGVMVVANADEPTFYTDHTFWLYRDSKWFRSSSHVSGWTRGGDPPSSLTNLRAPSQYVHYRHNAAGPHTSVNRPESPGSEVRDHRDSSPVAPVTPPPANPLPPNQVPPATPN